MNALWDRKQGIRSAVEPLSGTTGTAEATGLATRQGDYKRLLHPGRAGPARAVSAAHRRNQLAGPLPRRLTHRTAASVNLTLTSMSSGCLVMLA